MLKWLKNIGPGPLIAAAFIGPGTVTVCTLAGVNFGYALLWAMALSVIATIVLQEMSARLGLVTQKGLSELIRENIPGTVPRFIALLLILAAIVIGNAAYEAGNISGGVLGMEAIFGVLRLETGLISLNIYSLILGLLAFILLYIGRYKVLERFLVGLVIVMSLSFFLTAILTKPDLLEIVKGMLIPGTPEGSILTVVALIGTTVVPYNLFLHASLVKEKWNNIDDLKHARRDTVLAVILGGVVSMCIMISAAAIPAVEINSAADLALGIEPLFGAQAKIVLAIGLFAAGLTSAITAPLAAAYVARGCIGWQGDLRSKKFRAVWILVLLIGVLSSSSGLKSIEIIKFAQLANGILLPITAAFLIWIVNKETVLGVHKNRLRQNVLALIILGITVFLGLKSILKVFEVI